MQIVEIECAIGRREFDGKQVKEGTRRVLALCDDMWAIRPDEDGELADFNEVGGSSEPLFKLVHRPTGYAALSRKSWDEVLETLREIRAHDIAWDFTDPSRAKALGKDWAAIRRAVADRLAARESPQAADAVDPQDGDTHV